MSIKQAVQDLGEGAGDRGSWARRLAEGLGATEGHGSWYARVARSMDIEGIGSWRSRLVQGLGGAGGGGEPVFGIETLDPGTSTGTSSNQHYGYSFVPTRDLNLLGLRVFTPGTGDAQRQLVQVWDAEETVVASVDIEPVAAQWVEKDLGEPVMLSEGQLYHVTTGSFHGSLVQRYRDGSVTFADDLGFQGSVLLNTLEPPGEQLGPWAAHAGFADIIYQGLGGGGDGGGSDPLGGDFSGYAINEFPAGWSESHPSFEDNWSVVEGEQFANGVGVHVDLPDSGVRYLTADAAGTPLDVEITAKWRRGDTFGTQWTVGARIDPGHTAGQAYAVGVRSNEVRLQLSATVVLGSASFTHTANAWMWVKLRVEGGDQKVKAWADGSPEPEEWMIETSNSNITVPGPVGIGVQQGTGGRWAEWDEVHIEVLDA